MTTPTENLNISESPIFDPFPEPNTMPSGWDLSGLIVDPQSAPPAPSNDAPDA